MIEYTNRYGDVFTFELNERGNIDWKSKKGNFGFHRFGSEPDNFDDTKKSLEANKIVTNSMRDQSICDALLAEKPGNITFEINQKNLTAGLSVSDKESLMAMHAAFKYFKIILEPGGAVALAAAITSKIDVREKNVLVIASGGNVDKDVFEQCFKIDTI